jgi:hypothetical protein
MPASIPLLGAKSATPIGALFKKQLVKAYVGVKSGIVNLN